MTTYKAICHTQCYWLETLWLPGETYEGSIPPNHHFSEDGLIDGPLPPPEPALDPRSNNELRRALKRQPFNFDAPKSWNRKKLWAKLKEFEQAEGQDELTNASISEFVAACGFVAQSNAGKGAHERACDECISIKG